ncbi:MAG: hypothetical protein ACI8RD_006900 [Bacillariaceae sp.]|jgi:hypothetical protein
MKIYYTFLGIFCDTKLNDSHVDVNRFAWCYVISSVSIGNTSTRD